MSTNDGAAESRKDHTFRPLRSANVVDNNAANAHDELNDRLRTIPKFIGLHRRWLDRNAPLFYHLCGGQNSFGRHNCIRTGPFD